LKSRAPARSILGMRPFPQAPAGLLLVMLAAIAAGCGIPRDVGLAERCADFMRRAYPSAPIEITRSDASATSLTTIMARIDGVRTDIGEDAPLPRNLAVECRFDQNVLTGFRWTAEPLR
jgi:hypothetical protein